MIERDSPDAVQRMDIETTRRLFRQMDSETFPEYPPHYPPPAAWSEPPDDEAVLRAWSESSAARRDDLVIYAHLPYCRELCGFCGFAAFPMRRRGELDSYLDTLETEARRYAPVARQPALWLCVGGGTPSLLSNSQLERFFGILRECFDLKRAKIAFEAHPDSLDAGKLRLLKRFGVDWLAIGIQSRDARVLRGCGRSQDTARLSGLIRDARKAGIRNVQVDLMAGLPGQTAESFLSDVDVVSALEPERIYLFPYQRKGRVPLGRSRPPESGWLADGYREAVRRLAERGYELSCGRWVYKGTGGDWPYSYDQGEKPGPRGYSVLGLGTAAISYVRGRARYQNADTVPAYRRLLSEGRLGVMRRAALTSRDEMINFAVLSLLHRGVCSGRDFRDEFGRSLDRELGAPLARLESRGLLRKVRGRYYLKDREAGLLWVRRELFEPRVLESLAAKFGHGAVPGAACRSADPGRGPAPRSHGPLECRLEDGVEALARRLYAARRDAPSDGVVFRGGRGASDPGLPGLLRLAARLGLKDRALLVRGVREGEQGRLADLARCGLEILELECAGPPGADGKRALGEAKASGLRAAVRCPLTGRTSPESVVRRYARRYGVRDFRFVFGGAALRWGQALAALERAVRAGGSEARVLVRGMPVCARPEWADRIEPAPAAPVGPEHPSDALPGDGRKRSGPAADMVHPQACLNCRLLLDCPGVDAEYLRAHGESSIRPVGAAGKPPFPSGKRGRAASAKTAVLRRRGAGRLHG